MTPRAAEYARRRGALQLRCTSQRQQMAAVIASIQADLHKFDRGLSMVRRIRISPLVVAAGAALAMGLGAGRTVGFVSRAWLLFNSVQRFMRAVSPRE
jgi:hypothetical protein